MSGLSVDRLEGAVLSAMREEGVPALALAVTDRESTRYARGFGTTATDAVGQAVTPRTLFRIGSTTKPLTALMILSLVEDGLLDLDVPLVHYLPELRLHDPSARENVTVRALLAHRSGLPPGGEELGHAGPDALTAFARETLPTYELVAPPNLLFAYSNPGYSLLGHLAEHVTGMSYAESMRDRVFTPAGMARTSFEPSTARSHAFALPHVPDGDGVLQPVHELFDDPAGWPAGFAMSNLDDLARVARVLLNDGRGENDRVLGDALLGEMLTPQADLLDASGTTYGLGVFLRSHRGARLAEHGGSIPTYETAFSLAPDAGLGIIVLANRPLGGRLEGLVDELWELLLDLGTGPSSPESEQAREGDLVGAEGAFLGKRRGLARLHVHDDRAALVLNGRELPLHRLRHGVLVATREDGEEVAVGLPRNEAGRVEHVLVDGDVCSRIPDTDPSAPDPALLERLVGRYRSFDAIEITLDGDALVVRSHMAGGRRMPCVPLGDLRFASDYGVLEFIENDAGEIEHLMAWDQFPLERQER